MGEWFKMYFLVNTMSLNQLIITTIHFISRAVTAVSVSILHSHFSPSCPPNNFLLFWPWCEHPFHPFILPVRWYFECFFYSSKSFHPPHPCPTFICIIPPAFTLPSSLKSVSLTTSSLCLFSNPLLLYSFLSSLSLFFSPPGLLWGWQATSLLALPLSSLSLAPPHSPHYRFHSFSPISLLGLLLTVLLQEKTGFWSYPGSDLHSFSRRRATRFINTLNRNI